MPSLDPVTVSLTISIVNFVILMVIVSNQVDLSWVHVKKYVKKKLRIGTSSELFK